MSILRTSRAAVAVMLMSLPVAGFAQDILSVTNGDQTVTYTREALLALPQEIVVTSNDYVDDLTTFQGPSLKSVLEASAIGDDATLKMVAINDFASSVPADDAFEYQVILAVLLDGEEMSVRDKGPIWVIYPMTDNPELRDDIYNGRLVWQLKSITAE
ncbi:MAG: hypothetical protein KKC72_19520 [Alphaproteobacteria bacterium]|nr:hypothetical protein [Alphaproteobacteria bacterium]MBU1835963.1 hypothetical protein [Alphaproteobacteria bacterium]